jgi:hypothetical protein
MVTLPAIHDIHTYLRDTGWQQQSQTWNSASIWSYPNGHEVLLPPHDNLADSELRVSEILATLAIVEGRSSDQIAVDINTPFDDVQLYRTFPGGMSDGLMSITAGLRELRSARDLISAAARVVAEGPRPVFLGGTPGPVGELLQQIRLGPSYPEAHLFAVRVPLNVRVPLPENHESPDQSLDMPLGRQVGRQLHAAVAAVHAVTSRVTEDDLAPFDQTVQAGGSANLCEALSGLAGGQQHQQPFEVTFRWGRGVPANIPADTIRFADGSGSIIRAAATRLRQINFSGISVATGLVESLHGQPSNVDYWLIKIRGGMTAQSGDETGRPVWLRLSPAAYDRAIAAHLANQRVRAHGDRAAAKGRIELMVNDEDFDVLN